MVLNEDTWPEDEAAGTYRTYGELVLDDGEEYAKKWMSAQIIHMHKVFDDLVDIQRYDDELKRLLES